MIFLPNSYVNWREEFLRELLSVLFLRNTALCRVEGMVFTQTLILYLLNQLLWIVLNQLFTTMSPKFITVVPEFLIYYLILSCGSQNSEYCPLLTLSCVFFSVKKKSLNICLKKHRIFFPLFSYVYEGLTLHTECFPLGMKLYCLAWFFSSAAPLSQSETWKLIGLLQLLLPLPKNEAMYLVWSRVSISKRNWWAYLWDVTQNLQAVDMLLRGWKSALRGKKVKSTTVDLRLL